jgi:hypothetical protein
MTGLLTCTVLFDRVAFFGIRALKGGRFHPKLNMATRLIANKYREGKVKRTLKRELKVLEIVKGEANIAVEYSLWRDLSWLHIRKFQTGRPS